MRKVAELALWIGTARDARDIRGVLDLGIEAVVDLAMDEPPVHPTRELVYLRFPLVDGHGNPAWILRSAVDAVAGLLTAGVPTFGGVQRGGEPVADDRGDGNCETCGHPTRGSAHADRSRRRVSGPVAGGVGHCVGRVESSRPDTNRRWVVSVSGLPAFGRFDHDLQE